jgi:2-polyprenyl-3-methyl-5-hydroxy-6-metoxy-1,4-benzoquinol methylase
MADQPASGKTSGICDSYAALRSDVLDLIPQDARRILDVGCSTGALGKAAKQRDPSIEVIGLELDPVAAEMARGPLDRVIEGNADEIDIIAEGISRGYFDCIVYSEVLEHCCDPWLVLKRHRPALCRKGKVIASLPNALFWSVPGNLILGNWPYRERGIQDKTHPRFFTLKTMQAMFHAAGYRVSAMRRNYQIVERPMRGNRVLGRVAATMLFPLRNFFTFQYVFLLERQEIGSEEAEVKGV